MTWIKEIIEGLIEVYGTRDIYKLLELLEVSLIRKEFKTKIKGRFLRNIFDDEFIFVSNKLSEKEEKIVISHELGHLILHTDLSTSYYTENHLLIKNKYEIEANKFAAELLIPDDIDFSIYDSLTAKQLGCLLEVPEELVELKFRIGDIH
ncbi:ImmA/IrrE family metallo-endopeptidase [Tissierella praeacuta]|uniref:ImmA/IrrE family metallo-endopeptidase n=1 Tax=Tissierella praeacuta TaxID=43131 RepID=UPI00104D250F|nr:ImmA/IrrE family metallo-endopeptidase [Tissierella praeacuta]TCU69654.1 uncharacterized protein DUF955 [Tissierella praeacuta]